jgi:putative membrane protein
MHEGFLAAHIIAVISWMAGVLYLPRLFVYHCQVEVGSAQSELFKTMERRLLFGITLPAAVVSWICGLVLVCQVGLAGNYWLHAKLLLVVLLSVYTALLAVWRRAFAQDRNTRSQNFYRVVNELPTLLMIGIVILVVVKPF